MSDPLRRPSACPLLLVLACLTAASARLDAQDLSRVIPADAYSYMHIRADPSMDFVREANLGVWEAVKEARLHESVLTLLRTNQIGSEDLATIEGLIAHCSFLIGSVEWRQLAEHEMVYAEFPKTPFPGMPPGVSSMLMVCRPDLENVPSLERSLAGVLGSVADLTPELSLSSTETSADPPTRVYSLLVNKQYPFLQLGVRGDTILAGFGADVFGRALDQLEGGGDEALVDSPRFRNAVGELMSQSNQLVYFDVEGLVDYLFEQIGPMVKHRSGNDWRLGMAIDDLHRLADFIDTSVTAVHADGNLLVSECWTRYDAIAAETGNPIYESFCQPADASDLMDYIPADATSFSVSGGVDLRPLYRFGLERVSAYVPEASDGIVAWDGVQALLDLSIEDDLLSWVGSETVTITMPARRPLPGGGDAWISISRLRDKDGAKKVLSRVGAVYEAMVPPLLKRLESELGGPAMIPQIEVRDAGGSFPSFQRITCTFSIPNMPLPIPPLDMVCGVVGNQLVFASSEDALLRVMDVAAGEVDGVWDHPAMAGGRLPEGANVTGFSYVPVGKQLAEMTTAIGSAGGMASMMLTQAGRGDPDVERIGAFISDVLPRVTSILNSLDFLEDEVSYSESRNDGLTSYSRTTTRYRER